LLCCLCRFAARRRRNFTFGIADESCLGFDDLKKESRLALRKDLNLALIRGLHEKLVTLAPEMSMNSGSLTKLY